MTLNTEDLQSIAQLFEVSLKPVDEKLETINNRIETLEQKVSIIDQGIVVINQHLSVVDQRLDSLEQKFDAFEQRFDALEQRFDSLEQRFDSLEQRFNVLEQRFDSLEQQFTSFTQTTNLRLNKIEISIEHDLKRNINLLAEAYLPTSEKLDIITDTLTELKFSVDIIEKVVEKHSFDIKQLKKAQ